MELSKKTTILLSPALHGRLTQLASQRRTSLGELVRLACERQYGLTGNEGRVAAARALGEFDLPVADTAEMKRQSVPLADPALP